MSTDQIKFRITQAGYDALKKEIEAMELNKATVSNDISAAAALGDKKENSDYHMAASTAKQLDSSLLILRETLAQCVITQAVSSNIIDFGATVELQNLQTNQIVTYKILGEPEADIEKNLISELSPLGQKLLGLRINSEIAMSIRRQQGVWKVISIKYE